MNISKLILKKLKGGISPEEDIALNDWLNESSENREVFKSISTIYEEGNDISDLGFVDAKRSFKKFKEGLPKENEKVFKVRQLLPYAAIFVGILCMTFAYKFYGDGSNSEVQNYENSITMELENGEILVLDQIKDKKVSNENGEVLGNLSNNQITHSASETNTLVYTTLKIPNGKKFEVVLSDGTQVYMNSGSSLRYPVKFINGNKRKVFLTGEAFFDVEKDINNPFIVSTDAIDVEVLGTEFNVSAYPEDLETNTVLVEGSVKLSSSSNTSKNENTSVLLKPGFKAEWNNSNGTSKLTEVDTDIYTGWMDGKLIFRNLSFQQIILKMERYYGVNIENTFDSLNDEVFTASFENEPLEEVLASFSENKKFNYSIQEDRIIITKP